MANNSQYPGIQPPRPPVAPMGPPLNAYPSVPMQFRATGPPRQPPPYMPIVSPQFIPVGRPNMVSQPMQHLHPRPGVPPPGIVPPPPPPPGPQSFSVPDGQSSRPIVSVSPPDQHAVPTANGYVNGLTYSISTPAIAQVPLNAEASNQYQSTSLINLPSFPLGGPTVTPVVQPTEQVTDDVIKVVEKPPSDWIEHTSHKGKKYYHNKKTKLSSWEKPLELMSPIERADATTNWKEYPAPNGRKYYYNKVTKQSKWRIPDELKLAREQLKTEQQKSTKDPVNEASVPSLTIGADSPSLRAHDPESSPVSVTPSIATVGEETIVPATLPDSAAQTSNTEDVSAKDAIFAAGIIEKSNSGVVTDDNADVTALEEIATENKQDAKIAFMALLESANVASDWTWDQTMRVIVNDPRYGALRPLGERKQAFIEFVGQKKKQEAEERRNKQKQAREEFKKMLEDSKEITSSTKWSKAIALFEDDDRFKAVERSKDREDIFNDYVTELEKQERSKALEEYKRNKKDYIEFLRSCDFLTASSQWRKVQDRLEVDESCTRLEKIDRLEIFQEYIRDLEKEEEEQRKLRMEETRKTERKNRDEFRKLMDEHVASGMLTSKSQWRDYGTKVKDLPAYLAVSSNTSGATPKELFEDVIEELEKQFLEDKDQIKEAVKMKKVSILSTWTVEDFKNAIAEDISSPAVSDINLNIVFEELLEKVRERDEKEAKRRKHIGDDFYMALTTSKDISSSSRWDDFKPIFEERVQSWFTVEESFFKEIFDTYIAELKKAREERKHREDRAKDRDRNRNRRSEKSRRDKDRSKKDKDKKHRKRHLDDMSLDEARDSHRHSAERKKTKQLEQQSSVSVEYDSRHKRYKRDHRRGDYDDQKEAEDGEFW